jgi:hypothetical protein
MAQVQRTTRKYYFSCGSGNNFRSTKEVWAEPADVLAAQKRDGGTVTCYHDAQKKRVYRTNVPANRLSAT